MPAPSAPTDLAVMCAIPTLTLVDLLLPQRGTVWGIALMTPVFIVRQAGHVARPVWRTSCVMVAVTAMMLPLLPAPVAAMERAVRIGALIASLQVTINLLLRALSRVPRAQHPLACWLEPDHLHRATTRRSWFSCKLTRLDLPLQQRSANHFCRNVSDQANC